jgi:hypothetical protein
VWTWVFIVWLLLVITRAISEGVENIGRGRTAVGVVKLVLGVFFAWGIVLLFQRRYQARVFWLVLLSVLSALCAGLAVLVPGEQRNLVLAAVLWFATWALYFARSRRLRTALQEPTEFVAPAV